MYSCQINFSFKITLVGLVANEYIEIQILCIVQIFHLLNIGKAERNPWSEEEKKAVTKHLGEFIRLKKIPGKRQIEEVIQKEKCLQRRTWKHIKYCVKNIISKK